MLTLNQNGDVSTVKEYLFKENNDHFLCYIKKTLVVVRCGLPEDCLALDHESFTGWFTSDDFWNEKNM